MNNILIYTLAISAGIGAIYFLVKKGLIEEIFDAVMTFLED